MLKIRKSNILLLLITCFSALYRVVFVLHDVFPSGADIGLHESLIHSITQGGNINFMWNDYHMGGGTSNTFPGFHIFTASLILFTGLPDYFAEAFVSIIFSSLTIVVAYLLSRKILNEPAALIAAFLVSVSYYDVYMLLWSGYPNTITLLLIPLVFYLLLETRYSRLPRLTTTSLLCGAIFLTHSLSSVILVTVIFTSAIIALMFRRWVSIDKKAVLEWLVPIFAGALIVSPFLFQAAPFYLNFNSPLYSGGLPKLQQALLPIRLVPFEYVLPFFVCFFLGFIFFKYLHVKSQPSKILLAVWLVVPTVLTQSYIAGFYMDYERFLYFAALPLTVLVAAGILASAKLLTKCAKWILAKKSNTFFDLNKAVAVFVLLLILLSCFELPHFSMAPSEGFQLQDQLQVMTAHGYEAVQWIKNCTPADAVIVSDALYGWWLGGFAERRTVSAVEPVFITNQREFEPALLASRLLDSAYLVDNGLIQVKEDGGYLGNRNPEFSAKKVADYYPTTFLNFNNSQTTITYKVGGNLTSVKVSDLSVKEMHIENSSISAAITVTLGNEFFNLTQKTTIYQGVNFVNMTETLSGSNLAISFVGIKFNVQTNGNLTAEKGFVELDDPDVHVAGQIIFTEMQPAVVNSSKNHFEMSFNLNNPQQATVNFYVSVFEYPNLGSTTATQAGLQELFNANTKNYTEKTADLPLDVYDYREAIADLNVSYVALRDFSQLPRFANDPLFSLVYVNKEVAILQVHSPSE